MDSSVEDSTLAASNSPSSSSSSSSTASSRVGAVTRTATDNSKDLNDVSRLYQQLDGLKIDDKSATSPVVQDDASAPAESSLSTPAPRPLPPLPPSATLPPTPLKHETSTDQVPTLRDMTTSPPSLISASRLGAAPPIYLRSGLSNVTQPPPPPPSSKALSSIPPPPPQLKASTPAASTSKPASASGAIARSYAVKGPDHGWNDAPPEIDAFLSSVAPTTAAAPSAEIKKRSKPNRRVYPGAGSSISSTSAATLFGSSGASLPPPPAPGAAPAKSLPGSSASPRMMMMKGASSPSTPAGVFGAYGAPAPQTPPLVAVPAPSFAPRTLSNLSAVDGAQSIQSSNNDNSNAETSFSLGDDPSDLTAPQLAASMQTFGQDAPVVSDPVLFNAKALYSYHSGLLSDLNFIQGDVLEILLVEESGWWKGRYSGTNGPSFSIPSNYVEIILDDPSLLPSPETSTTSSNFFSSPSDYPSSGIESTTTTMTTDSLSPQSIYSLPSASEKEPHHQCLSQIGRSSHPHSETIATSSTFDHKPYTRPTSPSTTIERPLWEQAFLFIPCDPELDSNSINTTAGKNRKGKWVCKACQGKPLEDGKKRKMGEWTGLKSSPSAIGTKAWEHWQKFHSQESEFNKTFSR